MQGTDRVAACREAGSSSSESFCLCPAMALERCRICAISQRRVIGFHDGTVLQTFAGCLPTYQGRRTCLAVVGYGSAGLTQTPHIVARVVCTKPFIYLRGSGCSVVSVSPGAMLPLISCWRPRLFPLAAVKPLGAWCEWGKTEGCHPPRAAKTGRDDCKCQRIRCGSACALARIAPLSRPYCGSERCMMRVICRAISCTFGSCRIDRWDPGTSISSNPAAATGAQPSP